MLKALLKALETRQGRILLILIAEGIILRFLAATQGMTVDFDSYRIVAEIINSGGSLYTETTRYNYGPVWGYVVAGMDLLASSPAVFRVMLVTLFNAADLVIAEWLRRRYGLRVFALFWFNPLTILGAGFFMQFDLLVIAVTLLLFQFKDRNELLFGLALGVSFMLKHVFIFLPVWLVFAGKMSLRSALLSYAVFAAGFIPFAQQYEGILRNVFGYSANSSGAQALFVPHVISWFVPPLIIMVLIMTGAGWLLRKRSTEELLIWYPVLLVLASPSVLHTYLILPALAIAVYPGILSAAYTAITAWLFTLDGLGVGWSFFINTAPDFMRATKAHGGEYTLPLILLAAMTAAWLWGVRIRTYLAQAAKYVRNETRLQWKQLHDYSDTR
ncbi:MAG: hypothetical protein TR69_WS6001001381 [candidate division WS6 bacterium OLB20]|uniref:DUF2029 domain-containing protein n=1 Tax=candidate division WS6 bacterium OLB20 TaxID=1617426 RepID=A0A136LWV5_9BACT|nr:MAG: hypothetical protein TR69_WS6001001381 [candidate division WS6 bacterium OLB20]